MGDRGRLHVSKLEDFAAWLEKMGWERRETKGEYEVLRMYRGGQKARKGRSSYLLVHESNTEKEHLALHGESSLWFSRWQRAKREGQC